MGLREYHRKRDFKRTGEPAGSEQPGRKAHSFVIQKHAASRLHHDFRLEMEGVLRSWAVPKGPSLDPRDKRLAVHVEDHPLEYEDFEGIIPAGEHGGGTVIVWDRGTWVPDGDPIAGYKKGKLKFRLEGEKLSGAWTLFRTGDPGDEDGAKNWMLIKSRDEHARPRADYDVQVLRPESVVTGRTLEQVAADADRVWRSNRSGKVASPSTPRARARAIGARAAAAGGLSVAGSSGRTSGSSPAESSARPQRTKTLRKEKPATPDASPGTEGPMPEAVELQLATLVTEAPTGDEWLHEVKFDGYRACAFLRDGKARMVSRNAKDWTLAFGRIAKGLPALKARQAIFDGEVCVHDEKGVTSFQALQQALGAGNDAALVYHVFDLLYLDGRDLRELSLEARKASLAALLAAPGVPAFVRYSDHIVGKGDQFNEQACELTLEGTVAKLRTAPHRPGRSRDWLKIRCQQRQEFVIGGFTPPGGSRTGLGALVVGFHASPGSADLIYAGKVGTGFTDKSLVEILDRLESIERDDPPFQNIPKGAVPRGTRWVAPVLACEVEFSNWTDEGMLRHPSFEGLREDKPASDVVREVAQETRKVTAGRKAKAAEAASAPAISRPRKSDGRIDVAGISLSSPDRILYPENGLTKLDIARYYDKVAKHILPFLVRRPLSLVRCPEGRAGECFYQKHSVAGLSDSVKRIAITERSGTRDYLYIEDIQGLLTFVQFGVLEFHAWGSRIDQLEKPDMMVFDLDPDPEVTWSRVVEATGEVRDHLAGLGLSSFLKTTGGKGLHVVVPLTRKLEWDDVKAFTKAVVENLARRHPGKYVTTLSKEKRKGRIFLDYLRNGRGATAVSAYSTRAREGATVSMPLPWSALDDTLDPRAYTAMTVPTLLAGRRSDPWAEFHSVRQSITAAMRKAVGKT